MSNASVCAGSNSSLLCAFNIGSSITNLLLFPVWSVYIIQKGIIRSSYDKNTHLNSYLCRTDTRINILTTWNPYHRHPFEGVYAILGLCKTYEGNLRYNPKMLAIRPQFFMPLISLLTQESKNISLLYIYYWEFNFFVLNLHPQIKKRWWWNGRHATLRG